MVSIAYKVILRRMVAFFLLTPFLSLGYNIPEEKAEEELGEKYLLKLTTGDKLGDGDSSYTPVVLFNKNYFEKYYAKGIPLVGIENEYRKLLKDFDKGNQNYAFLAIIKDDESFPIIPMNKYIDLVTLINKDDNGVACSSFSIFDKKYQRLKKVYYRYATRPEMENVPIKVSSINNYGYKTQVWVAAVFDEEKFKAYFYDYEEKRFRDPTVSLFWTTSWDDLKRRWEKLLAEGNKSEVITQIRIISESGRFNPKLCVGGEAWKERIDGFYKEKSLYPSFTIINSTGVDCEGEIDWVNSKTRKSVATTPISVIKNGWSSKVNIPSEEFAKLNDGETLSPTVRFWAPNNRCCGEIERKSVFKFEKYGEDFEYKVEGADESWLSETNATIEVKLENRNGKKCIISYLDKNEELNSDTHIISIPAHTEVSIEIKEPASKKVIGREDIKKDSLHKGKTNRPIIIKLIPSKPKAKPKLAKVDIVLPKEGLFTLSINNGLGGVVFNGNLDDYENGASIKDRLVNAANIPVLISNGIDIQEILDSYLISPKEISSGWLLSRHANGYIISFNGSIPSDKYLELPKTLKVVNRDECIAAILRINKQPVEKRKLMKTVSEKMPSWKDALIGAAKNNNCAATVVLTNKTRRELFADVLTEKIAANSSVRLSGEKIGNIKFREDGYAFDEYSSNSFYIESDPLGNDQSISISEETLVKKPVTKVRFKDAVNISEVKISYSDNMLYSSKDIANGIELRMHIEISNIEIKWNNGKTTSVTLQKPLYRYGDVDITITDAMPSEIKPSEPEPKSEPKVEEVSTISDSTPSPESDEEKKIKEGRKLVDGMRERIIDRIENIKDLQKPGNTPKPGKSNNAEELKKGIIKQVLQAKQTLQNNGLKIESEVVVVEDYLFYEESDKEYRDYVLDVLKLLKKE